MACTCVPNEPVCQFCRDELETERRHDEDDDRWDGFTGRMESTMSTGRTSVSELAKLLAERRSTSTEQVSLRRNAKGDVQIEVEAVCAEGESLTEAAVRCAEVYDQLVEWYPISENGAQK